MKKTGILVFFLALLMLWVPASHAAEISLFDWAFNYDGTFYEPGDTLVGIDGSGFDWVTGLGTVSATVGGVGLHSIIAFFDHEIDEFDNTFFNEVGVGGTPLAGQSWELDDPWYGDIWFNVRDRTLDNTNSVAAPNDVSMALGWDFSLLTDETAYIDFIVSDVAPNQGFFLEHIDPDSQASIYFSSKIEIDGQPIPEPSTVFLLGAGLLGLCMARNRTRKK